MCIHPSLISPLFCFFFFFFNDTATTEIYTLSLHDALPISRRATVRSGPERPRCFRAWREADRKSTRLNSSHSQISYAVFCLKKKKKPLDAARGRRGARRGRVRHGHAAAAGAGSWGLWALPTPGGGADGSARCFFFFNDTATTEIYTLSLHDALPISLNKEWRDRHAWLADVDILYSVRSEEHNSELQSQSNIGCRFLLFKKDKSE